MTVSGEVTNDIFLKIQIHAGEMHLQLRVQAALSEDGSSVPNTHARWLNNTWNSSSYGLMPFLASLGTHTYYYVYTYTHY